MTGKLNEMDLNKILENKVDIIVKYSIRLQDEIKTFIIELPVIQDYLKTNNGQKQLTDLIKYFLSIEEEVEIKKIQKLVRKEYSKKDFIIKKKQERRYGREVLIYVHIRNTITNKEFEDWVKPEQINSMKELNNLIFWEENGDDNLDI